MLAAGAQTLSVTFTPTDTTDYTTATASISLTVNKATPVITWTAPSPIAYGAALSAIQLDATANVSGTFAYSPAAGTVLTAGTQTLTATFTPTDTTDYATATAAVSLTVNKATPVITWATPAPIDYGTVLSAAQLDATANVSGTFVYNPPLGTYPTAGYDTLSVTFMPADTNDYTTATASVTLAVYNFTLSASPASLSVADGGSGSVTISVTDQGGFAGSVTLNVASLPHGVTAGFASNPVTGATSLTIHAARNAAKGTTTVWISGTSGSLTASTPISLAIVK